VKKRVRKKSTGVMRRVRKPIAPPSKVEEDIKRYDRARERERLRREQGGGDFSK
jgi:hypothetical protein